MNTFKHTPLKAIHGAIRVLQVGSEAHDGLIRCQIHDANVSQDSYIALSHVWGQEPSTYKIIVNGQSFWVKPNLWCFLHYAQRSLPGQNLWIDAVCINQSDLTERNG